ncbi:potassium channel family protein [Streptococcus suis]
MQNKKQVDRLRIIWHILRVTGFATFVTSFFSFIFLAAGLLLWLEPDFSSYGDSLWYSFVTTTTVGYGDLLVTTTLGRIISIVLETGLKLRTTSQSSCQHLSAVVDWQICSCFTLQI